MKDLEEYKASKAWLDSLKGEYRDTCKRRLQMFCDFINKDPDTIKAEREEDFKSHNVRYEKLAKNFYVHLLEKGQRKRGGKMKSGTAYAIVTAVRSFFSYHGPIYELNNRQMRIVKPQTSLVDYRLSISEIQAMCHAANERGRALILTAESTILRVSDVVALRRDHIENCIRKAEEFPVYLGEIVTVKEKVKANPFLHEDAVKTIQEYLATRTDKSEWLFPTNRGKKRGGHISEEFANDIVQRAFKNAGLKTPKNQRVRIHCLRKFGIGRLQDAGIETNLWKSIVGKKVPEAAYSSEKYREAYEKAMPRLMFTSLRNNHRKVAKMERELEMLRDELIELRSMVRELAQKQG